MNNNIFRLVFSKRLGMLVPASEMARSRSCKSPRRSHRRALAAMLALAPVVALAAQPAGLVPHATKAWSNATIDAARSSANQLTVRQNAAKAILNWQQLNLNRGESLIFDQQGNRSWAALNRIHDLNPSTISGKVQADGHLYFVNTNGIIFGEGAQISVGSLTASSLDITDTLFTNGILSAPGTASFIGSGGFVRVEEGAAITAATGGRVMLLGKDVENSGVINTPDGQTILAAGEKVYLLDSADPAGLLVEVDSGGTATNIGEIIAQHGNVTLVGLAVNQEGRISASTSVRANGSIHLLARDSVAKGSDGKAVIVEQAVKDAFGNVVKDESGEEVKESVFRPQRYGQIVIGKDSSTVVSVDMADKEEVLDAQKITPSRVKIEGRSIEVDGRIEAKGGNVMLDAKLDVEAVGVPAQLDPDLKNRIYLGEHASIDVSGVDATAPMSRHQLEIQLFSEQLKDAPLLRGGSLFGQKIYVDARKGTDLTNIEPFVALKGKTIAERMSAGGTINLITSSQVTTPGDVVIREGATLDVSGGSITYESGFIRESRLSYNGKLIPIAEASPDVPYEGTSDNSYIVTDPKWGVTRTWKLSASPSGTLYKSYRDGTSAGLVSVSAASAVLDGQFKAGTQPGDFQRLTPPAGGTLDVLTNNNIRLVRTPQALPAGFAVADDLPTEKAAELQLDTVFLDAGFDHVDFSANGIIVDAPIETSPDGSITLSGGGSVAVNADITAPGGKITIAGGAVSLADGVTISAAGLWTNDTPGIRGALTSPVALDGGNVSIVGTVAGANAFVLGEGSIIDTSSGAWLHADGGLQGGKGGNISLSGISGIEEGQAHSFGFSKGGTLTLSSFQDVQVGGEKPAAGTAFWLSESFFNAGGFSKYSVSASGAGDDLLVGDENGSVTVIQPQMQTLVARSGFNLRPSGSALEKVTRAVLKPAYQRSPASISLSAGDDLLVTQNAVIKTDVPTSNSGAKSSISLSAGGQLTILGDLIAPAGTIAASITGGTGGFDYDNTLSLFVGENAILSVAGQYVAAPYNNSGLLDAEVLNGGSIALDGGQRGMVVLKEGSLLDVSGISGEADITTKDGPVRQALDSAAGSIAISARNGFVLDGGLKGQANGTGAAGTLALSIAGAAETRDDNTHPNGSRALTITQQTISRADGLEAGTALDAVTGQGAISTQQVADGGFDRVDLAVNFDGGANSTLVLSEGLNLDVPEALTLDAGSLASSGSGTARVSTKNLTLTSQDAGAVPVTGDASVEFKADFIDLVNVVTVTGAKSTLLDAQLDIRGRGVSSFNPGAFKTAGELVLSARQIYPATNSQFGFEAIGTGSRIEVKSSGATPKAVLSAGGKLTLKADEIVQGGALRAPLGQITLEAANRLTLADGSLSSVSAEGELIPYGLTRLGGLDLLAPTTDLVASTLGDGLTAPTEKSITLRSPEIDLASGATVDISGGGDTLAYEWIEGIGGSTDILSQPGVYAVLPTLQGEYAPFDYNYQIGSDLKLGDAVYLSGVPGLADGIYALLPGRYALMPGAFMVQTSSATVTQGLSVAQLDGSTLASGYRTTLDGSSRDALFSTFRVTDGRIFRSAEGTISKAPAEYRLTTGNEFFTDLALDQGRVIPRLASDAGQLVLNASESLTLDAELIADMAEDARGALVDIVSDKISVVSTVGADDGTLQLAAGALNGLSADSLLLGGARSQTEDGLTIATGATEVTFANDVEHALEVKELIATATDTLALQENAVIATGNAVDNPGSETLISSGDGAFFAVSAINDLEFSRTGVAGVAGTLEIGRSAIVQAGRSLVLDATKTAKLDGSVSVGDGGSATLGANRILLGNPNDAIEGLRVDNSLLADLGDLDKVTLSSAQNLEIHGPMSIGDADLDLTLNTSGVKGNLSVGEIADIKARTLSLKNTTGITSVAAAGNGTLNVEAKTIAIEGRSTAATGKPVVGIGGVDTVSLETSGETKLSGVGETQINAGNTTITSARMSAASGTDYVIKTSGALTTDAASSPNTLAAADGLGAKIKLQGSSLRLGGKVELPSGQFTGVATSGDLNVVGGANITAASVPVNFDKSVEYTPGGIVILQADAGSVSVDAGASVNVDGAGDADAGTVKVSAVSGMFAVNGTLSGVGGSNGGEDGRFGMDVGTLADFGVINDKLNNGGFTKSREMRIRNGNVSIAADDTVTAQNFVLSADAGKVDVYGTVDASGSKGGNIEIYANNDLTLQAGGKLLAHATGDSAKAGDGVGDGGNVVLSSDSGTISAVVFDGNGKRLANAALIDVSGDTTGTVTGDAGKVTLHAGRTGVDNAAFNPVKTTGSSTAYTVSGITLTRGVVVAFKPNVNNTTTTPTLNGKTIRKNGGDALVAGDLKVGKTYLAVYDGTSFQLVSGDSNGSFAVGSGINVDKSATAAIKGAETVALEAVRTYEKSFVDSKAQLQIAADNQAFYSKSANILAGYEATQDGVSAILAPGVEIRSSNGDLTLSADWNMDATTNGTLAMAGAGALALRASGRLVLNGISDDFNGTTATAAFVPADSWSYRLVSSADMAAANPLATHFALVDQSLKAIMSSPSTATGAVSSNVIKLSSTVTGYTLAAAPTIAFTLNSIPAGAATSAKLNVSSTGEKALVKSDGRAINKEDLTAGVPYLAKYDAISDKYKLVDVSEVVLANGKIVRTGTGDIRIAAGGDLSMGNDSSVIYTAGRQADDLAGFTKPNKALYLTDGGDIDIRVQGDINGKFSSTGAQQTVTHWLFRQGGGSQNKQVSWWVRPDLFKQGVATLGGGDVTINAGGNITNFSASAATTARYASTDNYVVDGGGDVTVTSGADIYSGVYFAGQGDINIRAGGAIQPSSNTFGTTIALQDASAKVSAVESTFIETVFNPTWWAQSTTNIANPLGTTGDSSFFLTYGEQSAFQLDSLTGNVMLGLAKTANITGDLVSGLNSGTTAAATALQVLPATVTARAFGGDLSLGRIVLAPAANGNLELLAAGDVSTSGTALVAISDADASILPGVASPLAGSTTLGSVITQLRTSHAASPVHQKDSSPVTIVAKDGSISLIGDTGSSSDAGPGLLSPKAVYLHAGKDIELNADIQHVSSNDISVIEAGRDFAMPLDASTQVSVSGPGELLVQAGRNVNLGSTKGIVTVANTVNPNLPDEGASITVLAGLGEQGANVVDYIDHYIDPTGSGPAVLQGDVDKLAEYRKATTEAVTAYMRKLSGDESLSDANAMLQYLALDDDRQAVFAYRHLSSELLASGKSFAEAGTHDRGDNAIATLFPGTREYDGDLFLFNSQLRTLRDGSIDILTPGGVINAGVPTSSGVDIGIVTEFGGDIRAFAETGFQVEQSRVITQYGSDITVWVNNGDIDAGRGSKSAVSVPERLVSTDADGNTTIDVKAAAVGSGIRAQTYDPDGPNGGQTAPELGSVALIAPRGILNASEAGIAAGNFLAVATLVLGTENIQVSGTSTGVPAADTGSLAGSLSNVSNVASDATKAAAEDVARQVAQKSNPFDNSKSFLPSFITVEVIGLGDEKERP